MQSSEMVPAIIFALISVAVGYLLFRFIVDPASLKLKAHIADALKRFGLWLRAHVRQIVTGAVILIAAVVVLVLAIRFTGPLIRLVGGLFPRPLSSAESVAISAAEIESTPVGEPVVIAERGIIADHTVVDEARLDRLSPEAVDRAKAKLHIFYVHGTHGSQIIYGMKGLVDYKGQQFGGLDVDSVELSDSSQVDLVDWSDRVRTYLRDTENADTNVVVWAWSNELSSATEQTVKNYLQLTTDLETEFPNVRFVYMTGHLDGTGLAGNLHLRNDQIRAYCRDNSKILYDFEDIESYDPDGKYYGDKSVNDGCWYDSDGNGSLDRNWAKEWSEANPGKWYDCYAAHTYPLNANLKAYAAWWLWVRLAEEEASGESN